MWGRLYPYIYIYLFGVLRRFQHCTGHITTGSWKGRGNQYIQFVRVLYCKLPTNGKQLPAFPLEAVRGSNPRPQRWEARVLPLCHRAPPPIYTRMYKSCIRIPVTEALGPFDCAVTVTTGSVAGGSVASVCKIPIIEGDLRCILVSVVVECEF